MIRGLRRKLVLYAGISIFGLLTIILSAINITNFALVAEDADRVTQMIAEQGGAFAEPIFQPEPLPETSGSQDIPTSQENTNSHDIPFQPGPGPMGPFSPETSQSVRYFTIKIDAEGNATIHKLAFTLESVRPEDALAWGKTLSGKGWTRTYYRFRTYTVNDDGYTYVTVIDYSRELSPSYRVLWGSIIGGVAGTLLSILLLIPVSKYFVMPLESAQKKQRRFISDASHELKTPLSIISANAEIIEIESGESESTKAILKQVERLNSLVKNLNALARIEEEHHGEVGTFDLAGDCREIVESYKPSFAAKSISFSEEIPETLPFSGDESMLRRLVNILLENAVKYALSQAEFHLYQVGARTCIKVINDADVQEGSLDRVFERFYRSDASRASSVEGSGLGLSIAKEIVLAHKGRILAKGDQGRFIIKVEF